MLDSVDNERTFFLFCLLFIRIAEVADFGRSSAYNRPKLRSKSIWNIVENAAL